MGWNEVEEGNSGTGGSFLSIKDGETKVVHIIDDEPHTFQSVFFNALKKSAVVDPDDNPVDGVKGFDVRTRHAINVYDYDDQKVKALAGSNALFNQFKAIHAEWEGFGSLDVRISRKGSGFDTKYQVVPTAKCRWDESLIEGMEIQDLTVLFAPTPRAMVESYMEGTDPSTTFNPEELDNADEVADDLNAGEVPDTVEDADEDMPAPPRKVATKPAPKPAGVKPPPPNAPTMGRNDLIMKLNHMAKSKMRYKKPGVWLADVQKFGGKDKKSMSQMGVDALMKLYKFVQTVK